MSFSVDPSIEGVTSPLAPLDFCEARLMLDARFVWIILIPKREGLVEIDDLPRDDRIRLLDETVKAGEIVRKIGEALGWPIYKLNIAALGNITRQLHVHVIGRRTSDAAWPAPVWGAGQAEPWSTDEVEWVTETWAKFL